MTNKIYKTNNYITETYFSSIGKKKVERSNYVFAGLQGLMIIALPIVVYFIFNSQI